MPSLSNPCCLTQAAQTLLVLEGPEQKMLLALKLLVPQCLLLHGMLPAAITYKGWRYIAAAPSFMEQVSGKIVQLTKATPSL